MKIFVIYLAVVLQFPLTLRAQTVTNEVKSEIIVDSFNPAKDSVIQAGILVTLEDGWHIYWRNSGDSGMPTYFEFDIPEGIKVTEIQWPVPKIFEFEGYASYGYEDKVLFPFQIILPKGKTNNPILIKVKIRSLICKDICKPYNDEIRKEIYLTQTIVPSSEVTELFKQISENLPEENRILDISINRFPDEISMIINSRRINLDKVSSLHFIPYENGIFKNSTKQKIVRNSNTVELTVEYDQFRTKTPESIDGILILEILSEEGIRKVGYEIKQKLEAKNQNNK